MASLFKTISEIFFPLIADKVLGEFCDFKPFMQAFKTLWGFADQSDLATTSCIPNTSQTDLIAPPAIIPVPAGADPSAFGFQSGVNEVLEGVASDAGADTTGLTADGANSTEELVAMNIKLQEILDALTLGNRTAKKSQRAIEGMEI